MTRTRSASGSTIGRCFPLICAPSPAFRRQERDRRTTRTSRPACHQRLSNAGFGSDQLMSAQRGLTLHRGQTASQRFVQVLQLCPCWQKGLTAASKAPSHSGIRCRKDAWHLHSGIGTDSSRTNGEHGPREASTFLRDFCVGSRTMTRVAGRGSDWPWCVSCRVSGQGQQPVEGERS